MSPLILKQQDSQPQSQTVVWQHNSLAEARYSLTAREQKVLLYVISMIEAEDDELKLYQIRVEDFARLTRKQKVPVFRFFEEPTRERERWDA